MKTGGKITFLLVFLASVFLVFVTLEIPKRSLEDSGYVAKTSNPKLDLAISYIEKTKQPMLGVKMLNSLIEEDSTDVEVLYWLGRFALMSGQYSKAEVRYKSLLNNNPVDTLRFMAQVGLEVAYYETGQQTKRLDLLRNMAKDIYLSNPVMSGRDSVVLSAVVTRINEIEMELNSIKNK
jgi:hypothetical protein